MIKYYLFGTFLLFALLTLPIIIRSQECDKDEGCDIENTEKKRSSPNPSSSINAGKSKDDEEALSSETPIYWDFNGLHQEDPKLIQFIKETVLIPPPRLLQRGRDAKLNTLNLTKTRFLTREALKGQFGQALLVEKLLKLDKSKKGKQKGFFIEAGACDGEAISNSLFFEVAHGFTGLLVEPNPDFLNELKTKGRNAWILPHCLSVTQRSEVVEFDAHMFNGGIINSEDRSRSKPGDVGIDRKLKPVPKQINKRTLKVQCFPLYSVLQALDNPKVDYFSLDIEGAEYPVLKSVPWDKVDIRVLGVEIAHTGAVFDGTTEDIVKLLEDQNYVYKDNAGHDRFFVKEKII